MAITKATEIKKAIKAADKRCSKEFLAAFEHQVELRLQKCIAEHNGGKKTLDAGVALMMFGGK